MKIKKSAKVKLATLRFPFNVYVLADGYHMLSLQQGHVWSTFNKDQLKSILLDAIPQGIAQECAMLLYTATDKPMPLAEFIGKGVIETPWIPGYAMDEAVVGMATFQDMMGGIDGWSSLYAMRERLKNLSLTECEAYYYLSVKYRVYDFAEEALERAKEIIGSLW